MLIEVHMLKNYPPVNLNRDDSGMPKTCFFGGVQRGRISSQCLKRSWRTSDIFRNLDSSGIRTRKLPELIKEKLIKMGVSEDLAEAAKRKMSGIGNKEGKETKDGKTQQILFYTVEEIECVAKRVKEAIDADGGDLKKFSERKATEFQDIAKDARISPISADIALFGRMATSKYFVNVDAAMQVAHAISTHAVNRESDYFIAMDDLLKADEEAGAGMIGDIDYNSSCYYEYAALDTDILRENLHNTPDAENLIERLIPAIIKCMIYTNPSAKQNTFAGHVLPDMIMIECKNTKIPLSYVNAFEEAVPTWGSSPKVVRTSIEKFINHVDCMDDVYGLDIGYRGYISPRYKDMSPKKGTTYTSLAEIINDCTEWIKENQR